MKYIKRIAAFVLSAAVCASLLTACAESSSKSAESAESSASKSETMHTLYVRDEFKSSEVTVTFENTSSGETEKVKMGKLSESDDYFLFSCEGDAALYNRAYITHDGSELLGVAFNKYVSGWSISSYGIVPFTEGEEPVESVDFKTETFDYNGNKKEVYIWTPKGYNQSSKEKYSTVYLLDGESKLSPDFSYGGSSLAGLESFYIGMEHPEKFGAVGAFSPTFGAIDSASWMEYLGKKKLDESSPFIYLYSGDPQDNEWSAKGMIKCLQQLNYPASKMAYTKYPTGMHTVPYWRNIFPEYLEAAFDKKVAAIEGKPMLDENETIPLDYAE